MVIQVIDSDKRKEAFFEIECLPPVGTLIDLEEFDNDELYISYPVLHREGNVLMYTYYLCETLEDALANR